MISCSGEITNNKFAFNTTASSPYWLRPQTLSTFLGSKSLLVIVLAIATYSEV